MTFAQQFPPLSSVSSGHKLLSCLDMTGKMRTYLLELVQQSIQVDNSVGLAKTDLNSSEVRSQLMQLSSTYGQTVTQTLQALEYEFKGVTSTTTQDYLTNLSTHLEEQITNEQKIAAQIQALAGVARHYLADLSHYGLDLDREPHLKQVFDYIEGQYHNSIGLRDVAQALGYSNTYLTNVVRRKTGQPVNQWIVRRRLAEACHLLLTTNHSIETIAFGVGYQNIEHFFRQFRKYFNITPQKWRNRARERSMLESTTDSVDLVRKILSGEETALSSLE